MGKCSTLIKKLFGGGDHNFWVSVWSPDSGQGSVHYGNYPNSSNKSFIRQGEFKFGVVSCLDYLDYLSLLVKLFEEIAQAYPLLLMENHLRMGL